MNRYEYFLEHAKDKGIEVIDYDFSDRIKGVYCDNVIALSRSLKTNKDKIEILVEEIEHHNTLTGITLNPQSKQEHLARRNALEKLVTIDSIIHGLKSSMSKYDLCDYLEINESTFDNAISHYINKHGLSVHIDSYVLYLQPLLLKEVSK